MQNRKEFIRQIGMGTLGGLGVIPLMADSREKRTAFKLVFRNIPLTAG